jgi:hypothetical protein
MRTATSRTTATKETVQWPAVWVHQTEAGEWIGTTHLFGQEHTVKATSEENCQRDLVAAMNINDTTWNALQEEITLKRAKLRRLKPGDWVAWGRTNWDNNPVQQDFAFWEAQVIAHPVRSGHEVVVLFNGLPLAVHKNQLYRVQPVIGVENMHTQYDYNS